MSKQSTVVSGFLNSVVSPVTLCLLKVTLILKDDWYGKFRSLITRWRNCKVFQQHGYNVISVIKADNDSIWDNDNAEWLKVRSEFGIEMIYPAKSDCRDTAGAEATCRIVEYGVKRGLCLANAHPCYWNWHYKYFLWVSNRLATTSNSAIRSPDGDQSRPLEDITFGYVSRKRISVELCSATPPGTMLLSKLKSSLGSHSAPKSEWLVAMMMVSDQVLALNPWTKRERKVKQFRAVPHGMTWQQFCNINSPGFFRHTMKLPQGFDETASIVLPTPSSIASKKLGLATPSMQRVKDKMKQIREQGEQLSLEQDELPLPKVPFLMIHSLPATLACQCTHFRLFTLS